MFARAIIKSKTCAAKTQVHSIWTVFRRKVTRDNSEPHINRALLKVCRSHPRPWKRHLRILTIQASSTPLQILVTTLWKTRSRKPVKILLLLLLSRTHAELNLQLSQPYVIMNRFQRHLQHVPEIIYVYLKISASL